MKYQNKCNAFQSRHFEIVKLDETVKKDNIDMFVKQI